MSSIPTNQPTVVLPITFNNSLSGNTTTENNFYEISSSYIGLSNAIKESGTTQLPVTGYKIQTIPQQGLAVRFSGSYRFLSVPADGLIYVTCSMYLLHTPFPTTSERGRTTSSIFLIDPVEDIKRGRIVAQQVLANSATDNQTGIFDVRNLSFSASLNDFIYPIITCNSMSGATGRPYFTPTYNALNPFTIYTGGAGNNATLQIKSDASNSTPGPSSEIIIEPAFTQPFTNTDCDSLINNVNKERPNPFLQDVDYATSTTRPVNYNALATNTATKATVPESFYTQESSIRPRYLGANLTSPDFNRGSSLNAQYSAGVNVLFWQSSYYFNTGSEKHANFFRLKGIITPDEKFTELTDDPDTITNLGISFGSIATKTPVSVYGDDPDSSGRSANYNYTSTAFNASGSYNGNYKGIAQFFTGSGLLLGGFYTTGSDTTLSNINANYGGQGGIVYNTGIVGTSAYRLVERAKSILVENGIIRP